MEDLLWSFLYINGAEPKSRVERRYRKKVEELSTEKNWLETKMYSQGELKKLRKAEEFTDYLKETGGHIRIKGVPKRNLIAPETGEIEMITGGIFPRNVKVLFGLDFYLQEKGVRNYFRLLSKLRDSWIHIVAASDNEEEINLGVQLYRNFEMTDILPIKHISFPNEKIYYGNTYKIVEKDKIEELAKGKGNIKEKNKFFRAITEAGYVF